jgi:CrcB protein
MVKLLLVAAGGGLGAVARFGVAVVGQRLWNGPFPFGTLCVNVLGCLAIGLLTGFFAGSDVFGASVGAREDVRRFAVVGFLGAFTTFSAFGMETFALFESGQYRLAGVNILVSNAVGLAAVWVGYRLAS